MTDLAEQAKQFWSAAYFVRRAPERDHSIAVKVLENLYLNAPGPIQDRADKLLVEIHDNANRNASRTN